MPGVVMLLSNAFRPDPRVLKEAESLRNNGFEITILCWDRQAELKAEEVLPSGVKIIRIQNIRSSYGIGARQLVQMVLFWVSAQRFLRKINPRIIHCHDFDTLPAGLFFGKFRHVPVIYDAHEYYVELVRPRLKGMAGRLILEIITYLENIGARKVSAIVTVDQTLSAIYQKRNRHVIVLGHYPIKSMAGMSNPVFSRSEITMIYTGRLSTDRGMLIYCDLLRKLIAIGVPAKLILAGSFLPESEKATFFEYTQEIIAAIDYLGWVPYEKISEIYHRADIGLAILLPEPRYVAAIPVKLFEYMANGLPVIASKFPSISRVVEDAMCGLLIDPLADIAPVAETIAGWYKDKTIPQTLGENGRQAILNKYNWENQVTHLASLYRTLE
ncbi:MAG TPA: glycosyltransferase family 4 protein [Anaerolineales bacterium]|nr:glycosyltransferase family 4 protein [Anaerolineales bacterium]